MQTNKIVEDGDMRLAKTISAPPEIIGATSAEAEISVTKDVERNGTATPPAPGPGISNRRLVIIMIGLCLAIFLTALEQVSDSPRDYS